MHVQAYSGRSAALCMFSGAPDSTVLKYILETSEIWLLFYFINCYCYCHYLYNNNNDDDDDDDDDDDYYYYYHYYYCCYYY